VTARDSTPKTEPACKRMRKHSRPTAIAKRKIIMIRHLAIATSLAIAAASQLSAAPAANAAPTARGECYQRFSDERADGLLPSGMKWSKFERTECGDLHAAPMSQGITNFSDDSGYAAGSHHHKGKGSST
jgi:hypothetical protein